MNDQELRDQGPPEVYDNTMLGQFEECKRKFYWFMRGLDCGFVPPYFAFGRAWQVALDVWYGAVGKDNALRLELAKQAAWVEWAACACGPGKDHDTYENLCALLELYAAEYPEEPFRVLGSEKGWVWPLPGTKWMLGGSLDDYIEWPAYGKLVMENKTSGMWLGDNYIAQWTHADQVTGYVWYLKQLLGEDVHGCLMNMACKRIPKTRKGETSQFARSLETRSDRELEEFVDRARTSIEDIVREWDRWAWHRTKNPINCTGGIGKSPCLFRAICLADRDFKKVDPLTYPGIVLRDGPWEPWLRG